MAMILNLVLLLQITFIFSSFVFFSIFPFFLKNFMNETASKQILNFGKQKPKQMETEPKQKKTKPKYNFFFENETENLKIE